jgi:topoisomerase-4 subunit A
MFARPWAPRKPNSASGGRTNFAEAPVADLAAIEQAMIEKEPITVVISEKAGSAA